MQRPRLGIGLIGTGFMGLSHALAWAAAARIFDLPVRIELEFLADVSPAQAGEAARRWGFARATGDWHELVADPRVDVVSITAPNALHHPMAMAAIAAGKHVHCEKPLAPTLAEADEMTRAAEAAGIRTQVGYNYLCNPLFALAREMILAGELGEIRSFRGIHAEDYMADAGVPFGFRHDPVGGGVAADLGSHILATAEYLCGPVTSLLGDCTVVVPERKDPATGALRKIEVEDVARAFLRFASGATGSIEASWIASGRNMQHDWEVTGARGALSFSQERLNELHFYSAADPAGRRGFRRIEAGPAHPPYGAFCVAPGHQLGFNDLKTIEMARFAAGIAAPGSSAPFDFRAGMGIQQRVSALRSSAQNGQRIALPSA